MKVVINKCYGGFGLSVFALKELVLLNAACISQRTPKVYYGGNIEKPERRGEWEVEWKKEFAEYKDIGDGFTAHPFGYNVFKGGILFDFTGRGENETRADKDLIAVVEKLGKEANGMCADLRVIEIPDGIEWHVHEYDGMESIEENHRSWS